MLGLRHPNALLPISQFILNSPLMVKPMHRTMDQELSLIINYYWPWCLQRLVDVRKAKWWLWMRGDTSFAGPVFLAWPYQVSHQNLATTWQPSQLSSRVLIFHIEYLLWVVAREWASPVTFGHPKPPIRLPVRVENKTTSTSDYKRVIRKGETTKPHHELCKAEERTSPISLTSP